MLLDTCVVIDVFRGHTGAIELLEALDERPYVSTITLAEIYAGARSQRAELIVRRFIGNCRVVSVTATIAEAAGTFMRHYRASHSVDIADALIAATAEQNGLKLSTLNVKHFPMFPKLKPAY